MTERFWRFVNKDGPIPEHQPHLGKCWVWTGFVKDTGYGQASHSGKRQRAAHRVSWFLAHGEWPADCVLHKCDNRRCVNPEHLFAGSRADNMRDLMAKGRYRQGKKYRGEEHPNAVLTEQQVRTIRAMRRCGLPRTWIMSRLGVTRSNVIAAVIGWKHIQP